MGTVPTFCTRRRYCNSPPIRVPAEAFVKSVSQRARTVFSETSWAMGAMSTARPAVHRMSARPESPSRSFTSVVEVGQRWPRPGSFEVMPKRLVSAPKVAPSRTVVSKLKRISRFGSREPLAGGQVQRSRVRPVPS